MLNEEVGRRIRMLRVEKEMTREELASKAEITTKFLYEIEKGTKGMSAKNLCKISTALSCSCDYLLFGIHKQNEMDAIENLYSELQKNSDERQRSIMVKILGILLEISEKNAK